MRASSAIRLRAPLALLALVLSLYGIRPSSALRPLARPLTSTSMTRHLVHPSSTSLTATQENSLTADAAAPFDYAPVLMVVSNLVLGALLFQLSKTLFTSAVPLVLILVFTLAVQVLLMDSKDVKQFYGISDSQTLVSSHLAAQELGQISAHHKELRAIDRRAGIMLEEIVDVAADLRSLGHRAETLEHDLDSHRSDLSSFMLEMHELHKVEV